MMFVFGFMFCVIDYCFLLLHEDYLIALSEATSTSSECGALSQSRYAPTPFLPSQLKNMRAKRPLH